MTKPSRSRRPFLEGDTISVVPHAWGKRDEVHASYEGWTIKIPGGIPGEPIQVRVVHVSKGGPVARGKLLHAPEAHAARREPPCEIHEECGGCGMQHVTETFALERKIFQAREALPGPWREPILSPHPFGYRAKTFLLPQMQDARLVFGARPPRGARLIDTSGCAVLRPELEKLAASIRGRLVGHTALLTTLRTIMLRANRAGQTQTTIVHRGELRAVGRFDFPTDALFAQRHDEETNRIQSDEDEILLAGEGPILEKFGPIEVSLPPTSFMQGNPHVAERLYRGAADALTGARVAELYCGGGAVGLWALHDHPKWTLHGVDKSPRAIAFARDNAQRNGLAKRATFTCGAAEDAKGDWDSVLVNPPRAGCHESVLAAIQASAAVRLVYLSCNPRTLARDAAALGWRVDSLTPADMFPQTPHLEVLAVLSRS